MAIEIENKYAQLCYYCHQNIRAGEGKTWRQRSGWKARHRHCGTDDVTREAREAAPEELGDNRPTVQERMDTAERVIAREQLQQQQDDRSGEDTSELAAKLADSGLIPEASELASRMEAAIEAALENILSQTADIFTATVPAMVERMLANARHVDIRVGKLPRVTLKVMHKSLPTILTAVVAGASPFLVGPAGSGKTTLAQQIAETLGRPFHMSSRVSSEYKLTGFMNAKGEYVRTQFREAYEHGGVFLFDEVDASDPDALTAFNAALAGNVADFPDGLVKRHPDFVAIAAGNTFGRGADRQYVGRNQLDAATLDRFQVYEVNYDEELEQRLAGNRSWVSYIQAVRKALEEDKVRHVVSPRASIVGARLLAQGQDIETVIEACVWKGLDRSVVSRAEAKCLSSRTSIVWDIADEAEAA